MNPTTEKKPLSFSTGALPQIGTPEYAQAQQGVVPKGFSNVITADSLASVQPYTIPPTSTQPTTGDLSLATNSAMGGITADANYTPPVVSEKETAKTGIKSIIAKITGQAAEVEAINNDAGLIEKKQRATAISNELDIMDKDFRDEVKVIKETAGGTLAGQQDKIRVAQERYENRRANVALSYKVAAGDYNGAQEIAQGKINSLREGNAQALQAYQLLANSINDDLTESEKLIVSANITRKENQAKAIETAYGDVLKNMSANPNTPASVYNAVDTASKAPNDTPASIYAAAGIYGGDTLDRQYKQAQIDKMKADTTKALADTKYANDVSVIDSPLVNAMINVNAGSAEGQQKRDNLRVAQLVKEGKTNEAKSLILSRVTSKMSAGERESELDRRNTIDALEEIQTSLNEYVSVSGDTNIIKGSIENFVNKLGQTSDPRLAEIKTRVTQATQKYRNAITGAAWGEQEDEEYKTIFPSGSNANKLNQTITATMLDALKNNERNAIGLFLGGSDVYDSVFGSPSSSVSTQATPVATVTPEDNSIFNSVIAPQTTTTKDTVPEPVATDMGAFNWPTFNFNKFFK